MSSLPRDRSIGLHAMLTGLPPLPTRSVSNRIVSIRFESNCCHFSILFVQIAEFMGAFLDIFSVVRASTVNESNRMLDAFFMRQKLQQHQNPATTTTQRRKIKCRNATRLKRADWIRILSHKNTHK